MDDWVLRAMQRWPNVPALFGWLGLDRRGRWLIKGEIISHPRIVQAINRNYAADEHGRWYFQNGPQRGYIQLAYAPFVLRATADGTGLETHTELPVTHPLGAYVDESGTVFLRTEHGTGEIAGAELEWLLSRLSLQDAPVCEDSIAAALSLPSGSRTPIELNLGASRLPLERLDAALAPTALGYVRDPQPRPGEKTSSGAPD